MSHYNALVTGGTGGIGTEVCKSLIDSGYKVAASWLEGVDDGPGWQAQMKSEGYDVEIVQGDVSDYEQSGEMVKEAETKLGPCDVLVNCAGITKDAFFHKMQPTQWESVIQINLNGVFNVTHHVFPGMRERGYGRIVNISSVNGQKGQFGQTNYAATKAGVHAFTMSLAQEGARKGVTVNTVSPGYIATPMTKMMPENVLQSLVDMVPVGRMGEPEEIARSVQFLVDEKSGFITGADLSVNGGLYMS